MLNKYLIYYNVNKIVLNALNLSSLTLKLRTGLKHKIFIRNAKVKKK